MPRTIHGLVNALTSSDIPSDKSDVLIGVSNLDPTKNRSEKLPLDELEAIIKAEATTNPLEIQKGNFDADAGSPALDFTTMRRGDSYNVTVAGSYNFNDGEGARYCPLDATVVAGTSLVHIRRRGPFGFVPLSEVGFTFGWDVTAVQARANSEAMETLKQRCWDELTGHRIFLRYSGVLRMDMALDNVHWTTVGTAITSGYGTVTYNAVAGTITRSAGDWTAGAPPNDFVASGAIKIVDPTNPDNNEIHMILSVSATVITVRSDGNDKDIQVSTTTTNATFTPLSGGERSALSLVGDHHASVILARYGKGHACIVYGSSTNTWTSSWIPGGGAATTADTPNNACLFTHGVEYFSPGGGSGLVVQNGNNDAQHSVNSIRVSSRDINYAAFHGWMIFAGEFRNIQSWNPTGDGVYLDNCNAIKFSMRVEMAGGRGCFIGGTGNTIHVDNENCKDWGIEISGSGNHISGYLEKNKYHTVAEDWNPQIKVTGLGNVFSGRLNVSTINTYGLAVYGSRDSVETTTVWQGTRQLDPSFDIRAAAKPWAGVSTGTTRANSRGSAYFTLKDVADGPGTMNLAGITGAFWTGREDVEVDIDALARTFTRPGGSDWTTAPTSLSVGDWFRVRRTASSNGLFRVSAVSATILTADARHAQEFTGDETDVQARFWKDIYVEVDNTVDFNLAARTITKSAGTSWVTLGYVVDGHILIRNAGLNDGIYEILAVTATVITLSVGETLTTATTITCDHAPIGDDSVVWWEGDSKLRIKIRKTEMGTGLFGLKVFDFLDGTTPEFSPVQFIGLPIKSTDRAYYRLRYEVSDPDYYIDNLPTVLGDDNFAICMSQNTDIGFRAFAFGYGPGKHVDARWQDNNVGDVAASSTNAINLFVNSLDHPSNTNAQIITIHSFEYAVSD